jgi:hypothetical protein
MYDWSNSATSSVAISGFLPILIQEACNAAAGFPRICPNLVTTSTDIELLFPGKNYKAMYYLTETNPLLLPSQSCISIPGGSACPGFPGVNAICSRSLASGYAVPCAEDGHIGGVDVDARPRACEV